MVSVSGLMMIRLKDRDLFDVTHIRRMKGADANSILITPNEEPGMRVEGSANRVSCVISNCFVSPRSNPTYVSGVEVFFNASGFSLSIGPDLILPKQASLGR
jgi:hypothetical protein